MPSFWKQLLARMGFKAREVDEQIVRQESNVHFVETPNDWAEHKDWIR